MSLHQKKYLLFFFSFLMIYAPLVRAQDKKEEQISFEKANLPTPKIEYQKSANSSFRPPFGDEEKDEANQELEKTQVCETDPKPEIERPVFELHSVIDRERDEDFRSPTVKNLKKISYRVPPPFLEEKEAEYDKTAAKAQGFNWRGALSQSFMFLGVQHGYALLFQKKTRQALKGKFFSDWGNSVRALRGWDDGNRFFTNYIAHPMQGSLTGFIYVQNSPQARRQRFGTSGDYWRSRMKALLWSTAWSTQFELGPISQASIGNVGLKGHQAWVDLVVTPTVGTALLVTEDALDRFVIKPLERRAKNFYVRIFLRMILNPTRNFSNLLRFKEPWFRDGGMGR